MIDRLTRTAAAALVVAFATPALAHTGQVAMHGFSAGFAHPIGGADHFLAMVAVGLLAAAIGGRGWTTPAGFLVGMIAGAGAGFAGLVLPGAEIMIAVSVLVLGALLAFGRDLPAVMLSALAAGFALFHGYAHAIEAPAGSGGLHYIAGFVIATTLLHAVGWMAVRLGGPALSRFVLPASGAATVLAGAGLVAGL